MRVDNSNNLPLVTIITVSYNSRDNLERTLKSIKQQTYPNIESIIIDGMSTDGSIDIITEFADKFVRDDDDCHRTCKWISEKDNGIYSAINKGLKIASGEIIGCLWDVFANESSLHKLISKMDAEVSDAVHGDLVYIDENDTVVRYWRTGHGRIKDGWMPGHPTLYMRRDVYERNGYFDEGLSCSADFEYMVRVFKDSSLKLAYVPEVVVRMFYGGYSTGGFKAYMRSIYQAYEALRRNDYRMPAFIIAKRIFRTMTQFKGNKCEARKG